MSETQGLEPTHSDEEILEGMRDYLRFRKAFPPYKGLRKEYGAGNARLLRLRRKLEAEMELAPVRIRRDAPPPAPPAAPAIDVEHLERQYEEIRGYLSELWTRLNDLSQRTATAADISNTAKRVDDLADSVRNIERGVHIAMNLVKSTLPPPTKDEEIHPAFRNKAAAKRLPLVPPPSEQDRLDKILSGQTQLAEAIAATNSRLNDLTRSTPAEAPQAPAPLLEALTESHAQLALAVDSTNARLTELVSATAAKHHGLDAAADRLEWAAKSLAAEVPPAGAAGGAAAESIESRLAELLVSQEATREAVNSTAVAIGALSGDGDGSLVPAISKALLPHMGDLERAIDESNAVEIVAGLADELAHVTSRIERNLRESRREVREAQKTTAGAIKAASRAAARKPGPDPLPPRLVALLREATLPRRAAAKTVKKIQRKKR